MGRPVTEEAIKRRKDYIEQYQRENLKRIVVKISRVTEADILEHLESQDNVQGYIKGLIRQDMNK